MPWPPIGIPRDVAQLLLHNSAWTDRYGIALAELVRGISVPGLSLHAVPIGLFQQREYYRSLFNGEPTSCVLGDGAYLVVDLPKVLSGSECEEVVLFWSDPSGFAGITNRLKAIVPSTWMLGSTTTVGALATLGRRTSPVISFAASRGGLELLGPPHLLRSVAVAALMDPRLAGDG